MTIEQETPNHRLVSPTAASGIATLGRPAEQQSLVFDGSVTGDAVPLPDFDGELKLPANAGDFTEDFGHLVNEEPSTVLCPGSAGDIVKIVEYARQTGLKVAVNGQGGQDRQRESHSLFGQSLVAGGIAIDAKSRDTIHEIGDGFANVDAGVRWSTLVRAAMATGQFPPVITDFPYLSVGGTLSIGGMGATSHRYGSQADNVEQLEIVTGRGDLVTASRTENRDLFDAVLAGAGQYGIILRAVVKLVPACTTVRATKIAYKDQATYLSDAVSVMQSGKIDDLNAGVFPNEEGGWLYALLAATYHGGSHPESSAAPALPLPGLLSPGAKVVEELEMPYLDWLFRLDPLWKQLDDGGHWSQAKPRLTVFVPQEHAAEIAQLILDELSLDDLGVGSVRLSPLNASVIKQPMLMLPTDTGSFFELSIGRFPAPDHPDIDGLVAQNRRFYDKAVALGAKRYLYGAIPDMTTEDWRRHYGAQWPVAEELKAKYDPDQVLTPGQHIFN